jgi:hypothetical protein
MTIFPKYITNFTQNQQTSTFCFVPHLRRYTRIALLLFCNYIKYNLYN